MDRLVLTARVVWQADRHVASVDSLPWRGGWLGKASQDQLIHAMRAWIEAHDGTDSLEQALADAGFPGWRRKPSCNWSSWSSLDG